MKAAIILTLVAVLSVTKVQASSEQYCATLAKLGVVYAEMRITGESIYFTKSISQPSSYDLIEAIWSELPSHVPPQQRKHTLIRVHGDVYTGCVMGVLYDAGYRKPKP